jgi:hypothetical protein
LAALVDGVVVGQVEVGDAVLAQGVKPLGLGSEDEALLDWGLDLGGRALEIAHHDLGGTEHGVDAIREEMADSVTFYHPAHPTVEQDVAGEYYAQCIGAMR